MAEKREKAFFAKIKERHCLNPGSEKETYHLVLDLQGSGIEYAVGDCLGIFPENDPILITQLLEKWQVASDTMIQDRQGVHYSLDHFLRYRANLSRIEKLTPKGLRDSSSFKDFETNGVHGAPNTALKNWDCGLANVQEPLSLHDLCLKLPPLLPRFYSIASSQSLVGAEAHLTVGLINGICSHYLCKNASLHEPIVPIFHHPSRHFSLCEPSFNKPILMIGPGTGIAPFRAFIQERLVKKCSAKNWLFFGEKYSERDFYYRSDWEPLVLEGKLRLDCAFSRDQENKIYVQHRLLENSKAVWAWIQEGAYLYVCGDASKMAKDVDKTLHQIIEREGSLSPNEAKLFIKELKQQNRYQRDIY